MLQTGVLDDGREMPSSDWVGVGGGLGILPRGPSEVDAACHWGQARGDGGGVVRTGGGSVQARVTVLLIAPFAFKEIKLFLVCATAGETPEEAFPSPRFSGSCQVWSSARFREPPKRPGGGTSLSGGCGDRPACGGSPRSSPCWPLEPGGPGLQRAVI